MDFDKHKEAVLLSSQMPTQNYKNNDKHKYLEPQTCTSLKYIYIYIYIYIMFMMKSKLRKTMNHE